MQQLVTTSPAAGSTAASRAARGLSLDTPGRWRCRPD